MKQLPPNFLRRMETLLGDEFDDFLKSYDREPVKGFRVNTDKISAQDFLKINPFGREKIPYVDSGFYLEYDKAGNHPYHHAGMIYVQEPAAMAPAEAVDIEPDWHILDMCAAPGGKSTQLKNKLGCNGVLVSNEIVMNRCKILTGNIERLGLKNCVTTCMDTTKLANTFPKTFDMVMVDAPCSGEGMFRKDDTAISMWSQENVELCAKRQAQILDNAALCLKDGGYIVYATCTFSLEENEMTVDSFLKRHPDFKIVPANERIVRHSDDGVIFDGCDNDQISLCRRFYPHKNRGEGQFTAVLKNTNEPYLKKHNSRPVAGCERVVTDFLDSVLVSYNKENLFMYSQKPVYFNTQFNVDNSVAFSCGVTIGEIKKNYIQPHHQFFMCFGKDFKNKIDLEADNDKLKKYLHGEEFETDCQNGWAVVMVNGCTVGGVKVTDGRAKNHYPKGLRTCY